MEKFYFKFKVGSTYDSECVTAKNARDAALKLISYYGAKHLIILHTYDHNMKEIFPNDIIW